MNFDEYALKYQAQVELAAGVSLDALAKEKAQIKLL